MAAAKSTNVAAAFTEIFTTPSWLTLHSTKALRSLSLIGGWNIKFIKFPSACKSYLPPSAIPSNAPFTKKNHFRHCKGMTFVLIVEAQTSTPEAWSGSAGFLPLYLVLLPINHFAIGLGVLQNNAISP